MEQISMNIPPDGVRTVVSECLAQIIEHDTTLRLTELARHEEIYILARALREVSAEQRKEIFKSLDDAERTAWINAAMDSGELARVICCW